VGDRTSGGLHADTHWIAVSSSRRDTLFTANDGGVWRTDNATGDLVSWTNLNAGLNITQFYSVALHPAEAGILLGGTQDNGTVLLGGDGAWRLTRGGDGGSTAIDQRDPQVLYHTFLGRNGCGGSASFGPEVSLNGGLTWTRRGCFACTVRPGNLHPRDRVAEFGTLAIHPRLVAEQGNVLYFGTHRLYRSADRGETWTGLGASDDGFGMTLTGSPSADDAAECDEWPYFITAIAPHAPDDLADAGTETVWIGTGDGRVQVTESAGALASAVFNDATRTPLPNRYVTDIAADPRDRHRAVVTYSGFNTRTPETPGHVFLTEDGGSTWIDISGDLPDLPANSIAFDPLSPGTLFAGTDIGVFYTSDRGATWNRLERGMPTTPVFMLRYHAASRSLVAATHGRGIFRLRLPPASSGQSSRPKR
jgi:hypothetical protein